MTLLSRRVGHVSELTSALCPYQGTPKNGWKSTKMIKPGAKWENIRIGLAF